MPEFKRASEKTEAELVRESIDANLPYLHSQRWAVEAGRLRGNIDRAAGNEKAAAQKALQDHYDTRDNPEISRAPLVEDAMRQIEARERG